MDLVQNKLGLTISKQRHSIISKHTFSYEPAGSKFVERGATMRIVTYGGAVSLDGFLAGADGSIDWLHFSKDVQQVMTDYWKDVDTILMGRKTYEVSVAQRPSSAKKPTRSKSSKRKEPAMRTSVFSRTLTKIDDPGVELVSSDAAEFVRELKQRPGKGI